MQEVSERLITASETRLRITEACEEYRPVARRATLLYFQIAEFTGVNCMYQARWAYWAWGLGGVHGRQLHVPGAQGQMGLGMAWGWLLGLVAGARAIVVRGREGLWPAAELSFTLLPCLSATRTPRRPLSTSLRSCTWRPSTTRSARRCRPSVSTTSSTTSPTRCLQGLWSGLVCVALHERLGVAHLDPQ